MTSKKPTEQSKGDKFTQGIPTKIWKETGSKHNPYITDKVLCYGYDFTQMVDKLSYVESLYLMLKGELPSEQQSQLLELALKLFITPGPRHPATRAAMNAGIGRTQITHILPIALNVLSAEYLGSKEVGNAMLFMAKNRNTNLETLIAERLSTSSETPNPIPGFGTLYGDIDSYTSQLVERVQKLALDLEYFNWCQLLCEKLESYKMSWLPTGLAAALYMDLDLDYRTGTCLFQIMQSPGLVAHGVEKANKPITDMPFISENNYVIRK